MATSMTGPEHHEAVEELIALTVMVVPADEPDRFECALRVLARHVAESNAAASRCDNPRDAGIGMEYRTEADAVLCSLVDVIVAGGVEDRDEARAQAYKLIAEAVATDA